MQNQAIMGPEFVEFIDKLRFERIMEGWDFESLPAVEGVEVQTIEASVGRASRREHMLIHFRIMELRQRGVLANEEFRQQIREMYADKVAATLGEVAERPEG
jgi:hypothetical protein